VRRSRTFAPNTKWAVSNTINVMSNPKNPFKLTKKEKAIEIIGIALFLAVFIGSFLKVMFF
jgi:hypothetical protein